MRSDLRTFLLACIIAAGSLQPATVAAEQRTFHLSTRDALASVARYNAFITSLGRQLRGVKLVPGGTRFAGQTCAGFGEVFQLGGVTVLDGAGSIRDLLPPQRERDAAALEAVFRRAGVMTWAAPVEAETDLRFWNSTEVPHGIRFAADALANGSHAGLVGAADDPHIFKFRVDARRGADLTGHYRFLIELRGWTWGDGGTATVAGERRCLAFVDLEPVDLRALAALVDATVSIPTLRSGLQARLVAIESDLLRRDNAAALGTLADFTALVLSYAPTTLDLAVVRRLVTTAISVRRDVAFRPVSATCGNGTRESNEQCDGDDQGGFSCTTLGFLAGTLGCDAACRFDTTQCVANPFCGDGISQPPEECDQGPANSDTAPDACRRNCRWAYCGDGVIDSAEDCEGTNLGGETCKSIGYDGGTLRCNVANCTFDDTHCFIRDE